jgi:tetratricopeptide (TPR) repeat protein
MKTPILNSIKSVLIASTLALHPSAVYSAASSSELLEKGIYTEETKGDVDAAIAIYQQIVTESKTGQSLAAQAQFRLGQCLLKKNRPNDAIAAFEKLVRDFPNEKELVEKAREHLPAEVALGPVTWADGERLQLNLTTATGIDIGTMVTRAHLVDSNGKKVWRVGRRMSGGGQMVSSVDVDPETFFPVTSYWKHTLLGEASAVFRKGEVELIRPGAEPATITLEKPVFDNEEAFHLFRRLPLEVGYKTTVSVITTLGGGTVLPIGVEVVSKETLDVPAGQIECFKVQLSLAQTLWFSTDEKRYLVKFEGGGATGQLASISHVKPDAPVQFQDAELGISLSAPANWVFYRPKAGRSEKKVSIGIFDPAADSDDAGMRLFKTESLSAAARSSARAWAEADFRDRLTKEVVDAKIRPDSWKTHNIGGRLGVSFLMDCTESGKPHVLFSLYVPGPKTSEQFLMVSSPEKFDGLKAAFDQIIASYRITK